MKIVKIHKVQMILLTSVNVVFVHSEHTIVKNCIS